MAYKKEITFVVLAALLFASGLGYRIWLNNKLNYKPQKQTTGQKPLQSKNPSKVDSTNLGKPYHPEKWIGLVVNDTITFIADHLPVYGCQVGNQTSNNYDIWANVAFQKNDTAYLSLSCGEKLLAIIDTLTFTANDVGEWSCYNYKAHIIGINDSIALQLTPSTHCLIYNNDSINKTSNGRTLFKMIYEINNVHIGQWLNKSKIRISKKWRELGKRLSETNKDETINESQNNQFIYQIVNRNSNDTIWAINSSWYTPKTGGKLFGTSIVGIIKNESFKTLWEKQWYQCDEEFDSEFTIIGVFNGTPDKPILFLVENGYYEETIYTLLFYNPNGDTVSEDPSYQGLTP